MKCVCEGDVLDPRDCPTTCLVRWAHDDIADQGQP